MTVHLAGNLPADDLNGLASAEKVLIEGHLARQQHVVIGIVKVSGTKTLEKEGFKPNPIVSFDRIEAVPEELLDEATSLLHRIFTARSGKTTLDFPDEGEAPEPPQLELAQLPDDAAYSFVIEDAPRGKFKLTVLTPSGAEAVVRHALARKTFNDDVPPPGEYQLVHLQGDLQDLARALMQEYEAGFHDGVEDAEVVEDGEDA